MAGVLAPFSSQDVRDSDVVRESNSVTRPRSKMVYIQIEYLV